MSRPKSNPVERAMNAVLDLTTEERNSFDVNLKIVEERIRTGQPGPRAPQRTRKPKPAPEPANV